MEPSNIRGHPKYFVDRKGTVTNQETLKDLKPGLVTGYPQVSLCSGGLVESLQVHRLVALAFIPNPQNLPVVHHKDENKLNCDSSNLEWVTYATNSQYSLNKPIASEDILGIRYWPSITKAASALLLAHGNISDTLRGKQKTCGGYTFRYISEEEYNEHK